MSDVMRNMRIPVSMDAEIEQHKPQMKITHRYIFFLSLGLKVYNYKTSSEKNPKLLEAIVNQHKETVHQMEVGIQTERFFKDFTDSRLSNILYLINIESERRENQKR